MAPKNLSRLDQTLYPLPQNQTRFFLSPQDMGAPEIEAFLIYLAVEKKRRPCKPRPVPQCPHLSL